MQQLSLSPWAPCPQVAAHSPLVRSALLHLELTGTHPAVEGSGAQGLQWTLAQALALHLRAGFDAGEPASAHSGARRSAGGATDPGPVQWYYWHSGTGAVVLT